MKTNKIGGIIISLLLIVALILLTSSSLEVTTIRDAILAPALVISLYLNFKKLKK